MICVCACHFMHRCERLSPIHPATCVHTLHAHLLCHPLIPPSMSCSMPAIQQGAGSATQAADSETKSRPPSQRAAAGAEGNRATPPLPEAKGVSQLREVGPMQRSSGDRLLSGGAARRSMSGKAGGGRRGSRGRASSRGGGGGGGGGHGLLSARSPPGRNSEAGATPGFFLRVGRRGGVRMGVCACASMPLPVLCFCLALRSKEGEPDWSS